MEENNQPGDEKNHQPGREAINREPLANLLNFDGYYYLQNGRKCGNRYLYCKFHRSRSCPGRGIIKQNGLFELSVQHSHAPGLFWERVTSSRREPYLHEGAERDLPFRVANRPMIRWRNRNIPRDTPTDLNSFHEILSNERWQNLRNYNGGSLEYYLLSDDDSTSILIMDLTFAKSLLERGTFLIHASSTATPSSVWCQQLMSIVCVRDNSLIPCAWVLMNTVSIEAYTSVFNKILNLVPEFKITSVLTSYSNFLKRSIQLLFPAAVISGSLHHYQEGIFNLIVKHGLHNYLLNENVDREITQFLHFTLTLPLLPSNTIEEAFQGTVETLSANAYTVLQLFFINYDQVWLREVGANHFCVHRNFERCTNVFEKYNIILSTIIGTHPDVWKFPERIASLQARSFRDNEKIDEHRATVVILKLNNRRINIKIRDAWDDLELGLITRNEFIFQCNSFITESSIKYLCINVLGVDLDNRIDDQNDNPADGNDICAIEKKKAKGDAEIPNPEQVDPLENGNDQFICCICRVTLPNHCFIPCGHLAACQECCAAYNALNIAEEDENNGRNNCPVCRREYQSTQIIIESLECCVCRQNPPTVCFVPCGHMALCNNCHLLEILNDNNNCLVCSESYNSLQKVFKI